MKLKQSMNKRYFSTITEGATYVLPTYFFNKETGQNEQVNEQLIDLLTFNSEGTVHEAILSMIIHDLQYKNGLVPSKETACAITKLQEALMWLEERQRDREIRNVQGTYTK